MLKNKRSQWLTQKLRPSLLCLMVSVLWSCPSPKSHNPVVRPTPAPTASPNPHPTPTPTVDPRPPHATPTPDVGDQDPIVRIDPNQPAPSTGDGSGSSRVNCGVRPGVGEANRDYYIIKLTGHGNVRGGVMWSSESDWPSSYDPRILVTDHRLHVRIKVLPDPQRCPKEDGTLTGAPNPYKKLKVTLALRSAGAPSTERVDSITLKDIAVNQCSPVRAFTQIPPHSSNTPMVLDLVDIQSDFYCNNVGSGYCPYAFIDKPACWALELHLSTDGTKDIPQS